jgi:hypothetical protein
MDQLSHRLLNLKTILSNSLPRYQTPGSLSATRKGLSLPRFGKHRPVVIAGQGVAVSGLFHSTC